MEKSEELGREVRGVRAGGQTQRDGGGAGGAQDGGDVGVEGEGLAGSG